MSDQRNLFIAIALSLAILLGFQYFYEIPKQEALQQQQQQDQAERATTGQPAQDGVVTPSVPAPAAESGQQPAPGSVTAPAIDAGSSRQAALKTSPRVAINGKRVQGSIALRGARIDDLVLSDYFEELTEDSPPVTLLSPQGAPSPYFADFGWSTTKEDIGKVRLPDSKSVWQADASELNDRRPLTLSWDNGQGLTFQQILALDENFMFTVTQRVINASSAPVNLYPYGRVRRVDTPDTLGFYILHEGPLGVFDETLLEVDYDDLVDADDNKEVVESTGGWIGFTDKYWLMALIPDNKQAFVGTFRYNRSGGRDGYQADFLGREPVSVAGGGEGQVVNRLFAGAKEVALLDRYEEQHGIPRFDLAVDFGWFYFLTKPLFYVLDYFFRLLGNFGLAIMLLTVAIKLIFFPLANKSYVSMSKMKKLQPEMVKLRERHGDDKQKMNQAMMEMYRREKVNPASGCLPILIQIPVFFALYKVMFVTIEMRHQPFYGYIRDLSAPDPTSLFNLFGLIPWDVPEFLMIGLLPLMMGASMYLQQKMNPQPADPVQAKIFQFMPLFFMFLLARFPAGLVIYWTWNNILSIVQQYVIMKRMGVPIGG
jgi:YidC/Oxa1 family membrane protein insertase